MAMVTKMVRCAACGSTHVMETEGLFCCKECGANLEKSMPAADLEQINRIQLMGGSEEVLKALRNKYRNLDISTWTRDSRLQVG